MDVKKPWQFNGGAASYFMLTIVSIVTTYIPILGWAFMLNYTGKWFAENSLLNERKITFKATYMEALKFTLVNTLLLLVTIGIYVFWYVPKTYRYMADHMVYLDETGAPVPAAEPTDAATATQAPIDPTNTATPAAG
jgi:uncharacterized membrane protein YjgN (DUF898 family)